jgi:hypothetical protein
MTIPRGGNLSRGRSLDRSRGSRGQVIGRGQAVDGHGGAFVVSHDLTAEDINEDTTIHEPVDEEGNRSDIAIWTDELTSSVLKKYEEIYLHKDRRPNLSKNMWKVIVDHINGISTEETFTEKQVKTKIDSMKKRYRIIKEKNHRPALELLKVFCGRIMMFVIDFGQLLQKQVEFQVVWMQVNHLLQLW